MLKYKCVNNPSHTYSQNTSDGFCTEAACRGIGYLMREDNVGKPTHYQQSPPINLPKIFSWIFLAVLILSTFVILGSWKLAPPQNTIKPTQVSPPTLQATSNNAPQRPSNAARQDIKTILIQPGPEGKDTFFGSVYVTDGGPAAAELSIGGWGDNYCDYLEFDLSGSPQSTDVVKAEVWLHGSAPNDPMLKMDRITQSWTVTGVTRSNNPSSVFYKNMPPVPSAPGWIITDITDLYKGWKDGLFPNYGIKLSPASTNQTNGSIASSNNLYPNFRPKLVITMTTSQTHTQTDKITASPAVPLDSKRFTVAIKSNPRAIFYIDDEDQPRGKTPKTITLEKSSDGGGHFIRFKAEGYKAQTKVINDGQEDFFVQLSELKSY